MLMIVQLEWEGGSTLTVSRFLCDRLVCRGVQETVSCMMAAKLLPLCRVDKDRTQYVHHATWQLLLPPTTITDSRVAIDSLIAG